MLKFFLTPLHLLKQQKPSSAISENSKKFPVSQENKKSSKKFVATSKRFKTLVDKCDNFKRKLEFLQNSSVAPPRSTENDSECLFIEPKSKNFPTDDFSKVDNSISYLNQQPSVDELQHSLNIRQSTHLRKATKRKLSKNNFIDDAVSNKCSPKTRKTDASKSDLVVSLEKLISPTKVLPRRRSVRSSVSSSSASDAQPVVVEGDADLPKKVTPMSRSIRSKSLGNRFCASVQKEKRRRILKSLASPVKLSQQKLHESDAVSRIKSDLANDKQELVKAHHEWRKEKENSILSLPVPEMEEVIDVNVWQHNEIVQRKKKSLLFKSVKERNRHSVLFNGGVASLLPEDNVKSAQVMESVTISQSEGGKNFKNESPPESIPAQKKEETLPPRDLCTISQISNPNMETLLTRIVSDLNKNESTETLVAQKNEESTLFVGRRCAVETFPPKLNVLLPKIDEDVESLTVENVDSTSTEIHLAPSTFNLKLEVRLPKIDDNSALDVDTGSLTKNQTSVANIPTSTPDFTNPIEILSASTIDLNSTKDISLADVNSEKLLAHVASSSANECRSDTYVIASKTKPLPPIATDEFSSSSVEIIEKYGEQTIATISDTIVNSDGNCAEKSVILVPSQPITVSSVSCEELLAPSYEMNQTPAELSSKRAVDEEVISSDGADLLGKDEVSAAVAQTKLKCAKLKKSIKDQNEKLLINIRTNFSLVSPSVLSVEKCKGQKTTGIGDNNGSLSKNRNVAEDHCTKETMTTNVMKNPQGSTSTPVKKRFSVNEILTMPASPHVRSVACQTTSDLHISLLVQEFPHLFHHQQRTGFNVYDTLGESTVVEPKLMSDLKTPLISGDAHSHCSLTVISSVTSSEKRIYENMFVDRSVLGDSSFQCANAAEKTVDDLSFLPLLPSTGKKFSHHDNDATGIDDERKLSVRLTFEPDPDLSIEEQKILENSICAASSSTPLLNRTAQSAYCADGKTVPCDHEADNVNVEKSIARKVTNESSEIDFTDLNLKNEAVDAVAAKMMVVETSHELKEVNKSNDNIDVVFNTEFVVGTCSLVQCTEQTDVKVGVSHLDPNLRSCLTGSAVENDVTGIGLKPNPEDLVVDDDDVDFIAGTPTSYTKRCVDDNLEKLMTQSFSLINNLEKDALAVTEKSDQTLFDSAGFRSQMSPSLIDCTRLPAQPPPSVLSASLGAQNNDQKSSPLLPPPPPVQPSETSVSGQKSSLDLFSSMAASSVAVDAARSIAVAMTGLKDDDVELVKRFCGRFLASLMDRVTEKSSHLVVKTDKRNRAARTFKYLQAIVNRVHIVSVGWVQACLNADKILDEDKFIPFDSSGECGPLRAHNSQNGATPLPLSWLHDYCIFFTEPVPTACTLTQLQEIVVKTGAVVISALKDFKKYPNLHHLIIVSDEEDSSQTSNTDIANWLQIYQAVAIEFNWLLEVIGRNRLVPFAEYELVEIPSNLLIKLNFPEKMLQYEKEDVDDSD